MITEELLSGENGTVSTGDQLPDLTSSVSDMLAPIMWLSVLFTVIFIALYISSMVRRRKLENALFDMQKTLHEMNERDKARMATPTPPSPKLRTGSETIAAAESSQETTDGTDSSLLS